MRSLLALSCSLMLVLSACDTRETTGSHEARVRNQPPAQCTETDFAACPAIAIESCPDGQEPVIDYSSDCCPHFSCQTACTADVPCPLGPAPVCPPGSALVITTASDCCPAYRCDPNVNCETADPVPCPLAMPWCGEGVEPIVVGNTEGCCPIYQCPCDVVVSGGGTLPDDAPRSDPTVCGCTFPTCAPGEQLQCYGDNICGYPCECVALRAECTTDADCPQYDCGPNTDCGVQMYCDTSMCLPAPGCDPSTGQDCPAVCGGICVGYTTAGCKADAECPAGQRCDMMCAGWACAYDPSGSTDCTCPPDLGTCTCDSAGNCYGEECSGQCVPTTVCNGTCSAPACENPVEVGVDECGCPIIECGACQPTGVPCSVPDCAGAIVIGSDESCCPVFCCPDASGSCPTPEPRPL
jgi:hypothetical protein